MKWMKFMNIDVMQAQAQPDTHQTQLNVPRAQWAKLLKFWQQQYLGLRLTDQQQ